MAPESESVGEQGFHVVPRHIVGTFALKERVGAHGEYGGGIALILQAVEVQLVRTTAQGQASGLMVGRDDDERLLGMLLIEFVGHLDSRVHIDNLVECGCGVIGVASPVYLAALKHKEEALLVAVHQVVDTALGYLPEREVVGLAVQLIGQAGGIDACRLGRLEEDYPVGAGLLGLEILEAAGYGIAALAAQLVEVLSVLVGLEKLGAGKEVKLGVNQLQTYLVVHVAVLDMGIECAGRGVVHGYRGRNADGISLVARLLGDALDARGEVFQYAQSAVLSLIAGSEGRTSRRTVGHAVGGRLSVDKSAIGKAREAERLYAYPALQCAEIRLGTVHLVDAHSVTDEKEYILGLGRSRGHHKCGNDRYKQKKSFTHNIYTVFECKVRERKLQNCYHLNTCFMGRPTHTCGVLRPKM